MFTENESDPLLYDYTPNNNIFAKNDSIIMKCTSSGTTGTPKPIKHTHAFIESISKESILFSLPVK